jgi:hypothetical protein
VAGALGLGDGFAGAVTGGALVTGEDPAGADAAEPPPPPPPHPARLNEIKQAIAHEWFILVLGTSI